MKTPPRISDAEWLVMKVLWERSPLAVADVTEALEDQTGWKLKTVQTLLNRLVKKGALDYEKRGRAFYYAPIVEESACVRAETQSFLQRVSGGALKPMLAWFIEEGDLSDEEIAELKRMIEKREERGAGEDEEPGNEIAGPESRARRNSR